jgi:guanylate kinase
MIEAGDLLEHAKVFDNFYGTSRRRGRRADGRGARRDPGNRLAGRAPGQGRDPEAQSVFILPPSRAELERRLRGRGQDDEAVIQRRLRDAESDSGSFQRI